MWRICRKTIFPRWHANRQNPIDNKNQNSSCAKVLVLSPATEKRRYSNRNQKEKQHANKQYKKCWGDPYFQFNSCHSVILETAGWLSTAAVLCINIHLKHIKNIFDHDHLLPSSCFFTRSVFAMPRHAITAKEKASLNTSLPVPLLLESESGTVKDKVSTDTHILKTIENLLDEYVANMQNSVGLASLSCNERKAFRSFQAAARLGSSQAFYNLGLCYESGKGTRVNLHRAVFCYRKAAMKGHGLASFNLAVYFMKGLGGLPVDPQTARLLLTEAATKDIPEAQLYLGIELLEENKFQEAVTIFEGLAERNVSEGQYYLGLCFENGWGMERNDQAAMQLFTKSAAQGNRKATLKLKNYSERKKIGSGRSSRFAESLFQILQSQSNANTVSVYTQKKPESATSKNSEKGLIHASLSVPELAASSKLPLQKSAAPSYLDLIIPFFSRHSYAIFCKPKVSFSIGEDTMTKDCSNNFDRLSSIPQVMQVKM